MKNIAAVLLAVALSGWGMATLAQEEPVKRYMITHPRDMGPSALAALRDNNGRRARGLRHRDIVAADLSEKDLEKLRRHPLFKHARIELDPPRFPQADNTTEIVPYGIAMIQADQLLPGTSPVKLCIIDTGYDISHGDLPGYERVTGESLVDDAWDAPGHEHGTHVAGTAAAIAGNGRGVVGVHPGSSLSLHIVKVFDDRGRWTSSSDLIDALDACIAAGSNIVSMSVGGFSPNNTERDAYRTALVQHGVLTVASAGNRGSDSYSYPASYDAIVSVAAVDSSYQRARFSQRNDQVELAAPGVGVDSTVLDNSYEVKEGTSMATPHVSGAAALLWSRHPGCDAYGIRYALALSALDLGASGRDNDFGYGLIRVKDADELIALEGCDLSEPDGFPGLPPQADLFATPLVGAAPLTVNFDASASTDDSAIVSRIWNFGEGEPVEDGELVAYTYELPGDYTASVLVVDDDGLTDTATVTIEVTGSGQPPVARFDFNPATAIDTGTVLRFDPRASEDPEGDELSYRWDFDDGKVSRKKRPFHRFASAGTYEVELTVKDPQDWQDSARQTVTVAPAPPFTPGAITLSVKLKKAGSRARLRWSGAITDKVKVLRNGSKIKRTRNDGQWRDSEYSPGDSYQVCNTNSQECSAATLP